MGERPSETTQDGDLDVDALMNEIFAEEDRARGRNATGRRPMPAKHREPSSMSTGVSVGVAVGVFLFLIAGWAGFVGAIVVGIGVGCWAARARPLDRLFGE
jgi:hypothetical protein